MSKGSSRRSCLDSDIPAWTLRRKIDRMSQSLSDRIDDIASARERLVIGLSSGTSFDGIDAVLVRLSGRGDDVRADLVSFLCEPFDRLLRGRISGAATLTAPELTRLSFELGEAFASAAMAVVAQARVAPRDVRLIGSHGQTVFHEHPESGRPGVTLQIGEADIIARRTGLTTVSDFRVADVAAGGSGAPLVPLVDWLLFRKPGVRQIFLNVGGIANITCVTERLEDVVGFDTGPGNALIDETIRMAIGDPGAIDDDGRRALSGDVDQRAVEVFLTDAYFSLPPPKSTCRRMFGREAALRLTDLVHRGRGPDSLTDRELNDVLATAARVTAQAVADSLRFLPPGPEVSRVVVSGGGVRNGAIMAELEALLAPTPVTCFDQHGQGADAKEAVAFAVLADRTLAGMPGNVPAVTGAAHPVVLGKISTGM